MTTAELLEYFQQHMEAIAKMEAYIKTPEMISYKEMIEEIEIDHFAGYEGFLPLLLLSSYDAVMENTCRRLFFRWFGEAAERMGGERIVNFVKEMLLDEGEKWEKRQKRLAFRQEIKKAGQG